MAKQKVKTRTRTITKTIRSKAKGALSGGNLRKQATKAAIGVGAGLAASFILARIAPDFADEAGIIAASFGGGVPGTVVWTLLGRRITEAVSGFTGAPGIVGAGQQVGL